jgi:alkylation response protein AidB-like acyl-CoA dehydrogenase
MRAQRPKLPEAAITLVNKRMPPERCEQMAYRELSLNLPPEYETLKQSMHKFAAEVMRPAAAALDKMPNPSDVAAADSPLWHVLQVAYSLGYHAAGIPTEFGGLGLRGLARHILLEELGWGSAGLAISIAVAGFPFSAAAMSGNRSLVERFVKPFIADRNASLIGCWAISEPAHGSDELAVAMDEFYNSAIRAQVVAKEQGDEYVISGQKAAWVSNGAIATHALTYLSLDRSIGLAGGGIAFVPLDLPGVGKGRPFNKIGQRDLAQAEIFFDQVRIPKQYMFVGAANYQLTLTRTLTAATAAMAAIFTGVARAAYEEALGHAQQRVQGGKALADHQLVQKRLFDMFTKVEAARALSRAIMIYNHGSSTPSLENAIAAKTFCTQAAFETASDAVQLLGANGLSKECLVEKLFRDARVSLIEDGSNDVLSLTAMRQILIHGDHS